MELNQIIQIKEDNYIRSKRLHKRCLDRYGEEDPRTVKAFLRMSALGRDVPKELKPGRECPGCRRIILINCGFCSACGKAILY